MHYVYYLAPLHVSIHILSHSIENKPYALFSIRIQVSLSLMVHHCTVFNVVQAFCLWVSPSNFTDVNHAGRDGYDQSKKPLIDHFILFYSIFVRLFVFIASGLRQFNLEGTFRKQKLNMIT